MSFFAERAIINIDISALLARIMTSTADSITNIEVTCITITNTSWMNYIIAIHSWITSQTFKLALTIASQATFITFRETS